MIGFGKPLDSVTKEDLQALIASRTAESRHFEYKLTLPGGSDSEKREFVKDVVAFANASGGHLIYGLEASEGVPVRLTGITGTSFDAEKLRLEQMARSSIEPVIHGLRIKEVSLSQEGYFALVLEIPKSLFGAHMIKGRRAFMHRTSAGTDEMDFSEIRAAFTGAEAATGRMRDFHADRVAKVAAGEGIFPLPDNAAAVLHVFPLEAFSSGFRCDLSRISAEPGRSALIPHSWATGWRPRYTLDGFAMTASSGIPNQPYVGYAHAFRNGALEFVWGELEMGHGPKTMRPGLFECITIAAAIRLSRAIETLNMSGPAYLFPSLLKIRGWKFLNITPAGLPSGEREVQHDHLVLPEVMMEFGSQIPLQNVLRSSFDVLWQACGWSQSSSYDRDGNYMLMAGVEVLLR